MSARRASAACHAWLPPLVPDLRTRAGSARSEAFSCEPPKALAGAAQRDERVAAAPPAVERGVVTTGAHGEIASRASLTARASVAGVNGLCRSAPGGSMVPVGP